MAFSTPIAFCIFNRPEKTARVFEAIARRRPERLLVIGDGPRAGHPTDQRLVEQSRQVIDRVDWPCRVETCFAATNLGCRQRMATGLTWAFNRAERLIVLEDDCLPDDSFFDFTETLLDRYEDTPEVMMISGDNFQPQRRTEYSYYFSRWTHIWGWASWRRAWNAYDVDINQWPKAKNNNLLRGIVTNPDEYAYWCEIFDQVYRGEVDTWDFSWMLACWLNGGVTVLPEVNLITNIGFDRTATHTTDAESVLSNLPARKIGALRHPPTIQSHEFADHWTFQNVFRREPEPAPVKPRLFDRLKQKIGRKWDRDRTKTCLRDN